MRKPAPETATMKISEVKSHLSGLVNTTFSKVVYVLILLVVLVPLIWSWVRGRRTPPEGPPTGPDDARFQQHANNEGA